MEQQLASDTAKDIDTISGQLIPVEGHRQAWNTINGTELEGHNDALTAEQARRINAQYDIEIQAGLHGIVTEVDDDTLPEDYLRLPTQREYAEAAEVVGGLQPGDVLFVEAYGFGRQAPEPAAQLDVLVESIDTSDMDPVQQRVAEVVMSAAVHYRTDIDKYKEQLKLQRSQLEDQRQNYEISAWRYASTLARLKGVRVVYADHDAFDVAMMQPLQGGKKLSELGMSDDESDREFFWRVQTQRELKARNTLKDWALEHLQADVTRPEEERKPKLVLLFGAGHAASLKQAFDDVGLEAYVVGMEISNVMKRAGEQIGRLALRDEPTKDYKKLRTVRAPRQTGTGVFKSKKGRDKFRKQREADESADGNEE